MNDEIEALRNLPPIASVVRKYGLFTKKSFGQHFIFDINLTDKIVRYAGDLKSATVIEIGPGPGALTRSILMANVKKLIAIEKDARVIPILEDIKDIAQERLEIIEGDALKIEEEKFGKDIKIIANLPYNISTPLLFKWLDKIETFSSLTLMFQKEVAERLTALPGTKDYGKASVMCQWLAEVRYEFDVPASAFTPPPKVTSAIVNLIPYESPKYPAEKSKMRKVCEVFNQRRKMLRGSLRQITNDPEMLLDKAGIRPEARPEELSIEEFARLAQAL